MGNASYDTLTITINADSKQANASIKTLSNNLQKLDETAKNINTRRIGEVKGLLLNIAKIDFSNVSKGLQDVVSAFKSFQNKAFMQSFNSLGNNGEFFKNLDFSKFADFKPKIDKNQTKDILTRELGILGEQADKLDFKFQKLGDTIANSLEKASASTKQAVKDTEELNVNVNSAFKGIAKSFKNILKYRIIRKIIQMIYQAIKMGTENIIQFDGATQEAFAQIKASAMYLVDSLGSMLAPLIQMVQPLLSAVLDSVAEIGNALGQVFAELNGQTQFAQATKDVEKYRQELKKTQSVGIDELNVLNQQGGSFEMVDLEAQENSASGLKDTFASLGTLIADILKDIMPLLKPIIQLVDTLLKVVNLIIKAIREPVNTILTSVVSAITKVVELVNGVVELLMPLIDAVLNVLSPILEIIATFIGTIFDVLGGVFDIVKSLLPIFKPYTDFLTKIVNVVATIFTYLKAIGETARAIITFDWGSIGGIWNNANAKVSEIWSGNSYATGGFPQEDGLFFANHTELVGTFSNGKTAVANNQEITQGIYEAVLQAMRESGGNNTEIIMDGQRVAEIVNKRQNNFGILAVKGGNINYGT